MERIHDFPFVSLEFDEDGGPVQPAQAEELRAHVAAARPTDLVFIAHGWRNSAHDARNLYTEFLGSLRANLGHPALAGAMAGRSFAVAGVFWPSKPFPEKEEDRDGGVAGVGDAADEAADQARVRAALDELAAGETRPAARQALEDARRLLPDLERPDAQDAFVADLLVLLEGSEPDPTEGLDRVRATDGHELFEKLAAPIVVPVEDEDAGGGGIDAVPTGFGDDGGTAGIGDVFSGIWHRAGRVLNLTTWYLMKNRSGTVGLQGLAPVVRTMASASPQTRIHLVGHSLGGRLVAAAAKGLAAPPVVRISTLTLLQAAFSHYGLASDNGDGVPGFFREVLAQSVVRGPILATHSRKDSVVGRTYALASRLAGDNVRAIGDENDKFGGIGRNGAQKTAEREILELGAAGAVYTWRAGRVHNLKGDTIIDDHSDIKGAEVTYAFASAVAAV
jgi:hypothetical protein